MRELERMLGQPEDRERPQSRPEPGIQRVRIASQLIAPVTLAGDPLGLVFILRDDDVVVRRIPDRKLMTPPDLPRDVPVADLLEAGGVRPPETFGDETDRTGSIG